MANVTRRSFVELLAGTLVSLPSLAGGLILAPRPAYADPDSTDASELAGKESEYVIIDVVQIWEVGLMVVDITKPEELDGGLIRYPPVPGASVTVTSRFNKQTATGTTNDNGVVNIDIRKLAVVQTGEDVLKLNDYHFNGSVTVEKDGWRKFETALIVVQGGEGLQVPAHPLDGEGTPYPRLVSFDEWDVLYCKNDFLVTPKNVDDHSVSVSLLRLPSNASATVELWVEGEQAPRASAEATIGTDGKNNRTADATFTAKFLKQGDKACLPVDGHFKIVLSQGNTSWSWPLALSVSQGVVDEPAGEEQKELCPINTIKGGVTSVGFNWPSSAPIVGGGNLNFWSPSLPINVYVNPFGLLQLTLKSPDWGYRSDSDNPDASGWGKFPYKSVSDQWAKKTKVAKKMADKTNSLVSEPGAIQQINLFKSISFAVNFQLVALAQWDSSKGLFQGEVAGQVLAAFNFTITENFFAGPIPVLITFSLDASLVFGLGAAAYSAKQEKSESLIDAIFDFSRWKWDYQNTGFNMTFSVTPSLSVGVGVRGIVSISVKGAITLTLFFGVPMGTQPEGLPGAHFAAGWSALISLVLELFLFTETFALYNKKFENFYDNWDSKLVAEQAEADVQNALANVSLGELLDRLVPITDEMLAMTAEATVKSNLNAQAEDGAPSAYVNWSERATEKEVELDDGTALHLVVYDLGTTPSPQDASDQGGTVGAQAEGDALPTISWLQASANVALPELGIQSLGVRNGVRPSSDVRLFGSDEQHVLSAAHVQVIDIGAPVGKTKEHGVWCFRIAAVQVDGQTRTRVIANCIDGDPTGSAKVIEFNTKVEGMPHADLYDYDFDVMVREEACGGGQKRSTVTFVILSGKRDKGSEASLTSASTDLVITHLWLASDDFAGGSDVLMPSNAGFFSGRASDIANVEPDKPHCISNLMIASCPEPDLGYDLSGIMFLDRYADTAEEVLGDTAHVCIGALMVRRMADIGGTYTYTMEKYQADWWRASLGDLDSTVYEADVCPSAAVGEPLYGFPWYIMLRGAKKVHYVRTVLTAYNPTGTYVFTNPVLCGDFDPSIRMVWCPEVNGFLTSYPTDPAQLEVDASERDYTTWTLQKTTWSNERTPKLQVEPIGPSGFNVVNFAVRGSFLFWPHSREADEDRAWDNEGKEVVTATEPVYQIMASRIRGDHFSDPFVVADLSNDTDMLSIVSVNNAVVLEALRTVYVDTGERGEDDTPLYHAADIWYTAVPAVRCVTATACEAEYPFVSPGETITFRVAVRNDGNTFLSGCTLKLCVYNEETQAYEYIPDAETSITFDANTIRESAYNQSDGQGGYTHTEPDFALAPGRTSVYAVTLTTPKDWSAGEKKVLFVATDGKLAPDYSGIAAQADDELEVVEFHIEPNAFQVSRPNTGGGQDSALSQTYTLTVVEDVAGGMYFQPAPTTMASTGDGGESAGGGSGGSGGSGSGSGSGSGGGRSAGGSGGSGGSTRNLSGNISLNRDTANRETLPNTRDSASTAGLGLTGAAITAVGAAVAAYERRRAKNE